MSSQGQRFRVFRIEFTDYPGPQHPCSPHLCNFHEEIHSYGPEEGETWSEVIDIQPCIYPCPEIFKTVGKGIGKLDVCRRPCFLHMVTGDRDGVELGPL